MTSNPLVSVIIPTYNRANELVMAVECVLNQHYQPVQLIVVDDGSTDDTKEKMIHFPQVEYILQEHSGQAAARNTGLERAKRSLITLGYATVLLNDGSILYSSVYLAFLILTIIIGVAYVSLINDITDIKEDLKCGKYNRISNIPIRFRWVFPSLFYSYGDKA